MIKIPRCCKRKMELKTAVVRPATIQKSQMPTAYTNESYTIYCYLILIFQCKKCGKIQMPVSPC